MCAYVKFECEVQFCLVLILLVRHCVNLACASLCASNVFMVVCAVPRMSSLDMFSFFYDSL